MVLGRRNSNAAANTAAAWSSHWRVNRDAYVRDPLWVSMIADRVKLSYLRPHLPASGTIVEFGCGSGRLLRFAVRHGLRGIGIDYSAEALTVVRQAAEADGVSLSLLQSDVRRTALPAASVDAVASTGLLEHFSDDDILAIIAEMVRVLKPGGLFYSDVLPAKWSLYRSLLWLRRQPNEIWERDCSRRDIERWLGQAGLERVHVFGAGVFPPILPYLERSDTVRVIMGQLVRATLPFWTVWDRTAIGEWAGHYYFATGRKPGGEGTRGHG